MGTWTLEQVTDRALDLYDQVDSDKLSVDEADSMVNALAVEHGYTMADVVERIETMASLGNVLVPSNAPYFPF